MKAFILLGGFFALLFVYACYTAFAGHTTSYRQRMTVIVETPAGEVRGSAVTEVTKVEHDSGLITPAARGVRSSVKGEAVVVEVTPGRYLFALLDGVEHFAYPAFELNVYSDPNDRSYAASMKKLASVPLDTPGFLDPNDVERPMHSSGFPILVTFTNISDPKTVQKVDPDNLATSFGPGVSLKAVTLEITREPVTNGRVKELLGWLGPYPEPVLDPDDDLFHPTHFGSSVRQGDFIRN